MLSRPPPREWCMEPCRGWSQAPGMHRWRRPQGNAPERRAPGGGRVGNAAAAGRGPTHGQLLQMHPGNRAPQCGAGRGPTLRWVAGGLHAVYESHPHQPHGFQLQRRTRGCSSACQIRARRRWPTCSSPRAVTAAPPACPRSPPLRPAIVWQPLCLSRPTLGSPVHRSAQTRAARLNFRIRRVAPLRATSPAPPAALIVNPSTPPTGNAVHTGRPRPRLTRKPRVPRSLVTRLSCRVT